MKFQVWSALNRTLKVNKTQTVFLITPNKSLKITPCTNNTKQDPQPHTTWLTRWLSRKIQSQVWFESKLHRMSHFPWPHIKIFSLRCPRRKRFAHTNRAPWSSFISALWEGVYHLSCRSAALPVRSLNVLLCQLLASSKEKLRLRTGASFLAI